MVCRCGLYMVVVVCVVRCLGWCWVLLLVMSECWCGGCFMWSVVMNRVLWMNCWVVSLMFCCIMGVWRCKIGLVLLCWVRCLCCCSLVLLRLSVNLWWVYFLLIFVWENNIRLLCFDVVWIFLLVIFLRFGVVGCCVLRMVIMFCWL